MSGGAHFGKYHYGVMKALYEQDLFPRILVGSSVGALALAALAGHKYSELYKLFNPEYGMVTDHLMHHNFKDYWEGI